jgi:hypothetical protein
MKTAWLVPIAFLITALPGCQSFRAPEPTTPYLALLQIGTYFTREQLLADQEAVRQLQTIHVDLETIGDKSVAMARAKCCGGPDEWDTAVFIPSNIETDVGDIVEARHHPRQGGLVVPNVVVRVREKQGGTSCRWVPENERLWLRNLYCDGLEKEGWKELQWVGRRCWVKELPE